jgi:hypothetical protein
MSNLAAKLKTIDIKKKKKSLWFWFHTMDQRAQENLNMFSAISRRNSVVVKLEEEAN